MGDMKYNIGDKVINRSYIFFFSNWFHYKEKMILSVSIVKQANKEWFSLYEDFDMEDFSSMNSHKRCTQSGGVQNIVSYPHRFLHCEKDKGEINLLIRNHFEAQYEEVEKEIARQIIITKDEIETLEDKLIDLKNKKVKMTCKSDNAYKWLREREIESIKLIG